MEPTSQHPNTPEPVAPAAPHIAGETAAGQAAPEKFVLPTSSRSVPLSPSPSPDAPQVLAGASRADDVPDAEAIARVREREAKARLMAIRRIEWVGIALATVLLGSAVWSWRTHSDAIENRRQVFNSSPVPRGPAAEAATPWRAARPAEVKEASQAIKSQLDAFKRDDFEKAAAWQSEELRQKFGSVDAFRRAIKGTYPAFVGYKSVRFGPAQSLPDGKALRIIAQLRGPKNEDFPAEYILVRESGAYRIASVSTPAVVPPKSPPQNPARPQDKAPLPEAEVI